MTRSLLPLLLAAVVGGGASGGTVAALMGASQPGPPGRTGPSGPPGIAGPTGPRGALGPAGAIGSTGAAAASSSPRLSGSYVLTDTAGHCPAGATDANAAVDVQTNAPGGSSTFGLCYIK